MVLRRSGLLGTSLLPVQSSKKHMLPFQILKKFGLLRLSLNLRIMNLRELGCFLPKPEKGGGTERLEERLNHLEKAKEAYDSGLKHCSNSIPLWLSLANLEEKMNGLSKARAVLTMARKKNPQNPELWLAAVRAELRHGNKKEADILMAKALQEFSNSGILWAASIEMVPRPQRKNQKKVDKARTWLNRAVTLAPDIGDFWALYYKFELQNGTDENQKDVLKRCGCCRTKARGVALGKEETAAENNRQ
ncbi:hypothetical protein M0R45_006368 [Rubus argutus]|uniref:Uncharacterized protein n=1 Tax=Rubus argutus TaxID=59490 RepID=A0AAW1YQX0_RUBAR